MSTTLVLSDHSRLVIQQTHEVAELFGFETRNKYRISGEQGQLLGYAAEQQKGVMGFLLRQFLGHWRGFEIHIFDHERHQVATARQRFRLIFQRMEVFDSNGRQLGAIQQRFSLFHKRFDVRNEREATILEVASPLFRLWTFEFTRLGRTLAVIRKKWSGALLEMFTDKDTFLVEFNAHELSETERKLILSAALFIDLRYFETHASK